MDDFIIIGRVDRQTLDVVCGRRGGKGRGGGVRHIEAGKEAAIEAEMQASRERAVVPLESRVQQFMEMLAEKQVLTCVSTGYLDGFVVVLICCAYGDIVKP